MSDNNGDQDETGVGTSQGKSIWISPEAVYLTEETARNTLRQSKEQYINEGAKGLILINGAGAVALLALLQAIWGKPGTAAFSEWILYGISGLLIGVAIAASIFMFRHRAFAKGALDDKRPLYQLAHWYVPGLSIFAFLIGVGCVVYGGLAHFPPDKPYTEVPTKIETVPAKPSPPLEMEKLTPPSSDQQK